MKTIGQLEIKLDSDRREFTGFASTRSVDSVGDILEPDGAEIRLPIPLLLEHDRSKPIGEVFFARVEGDGIRIRGRIARADEPATLRTFLDEVWASIKTRLRRGLSVGFQPLKRVKLGDGYRYTKWRLHEISLCVIPANRDAAILSARSNQAPARREGCVYLDKPRDRHEGSVYLRSETRDRHEGAVYLDPRRQEHRGSVFLDELHPLTPSKRPRGAVYLGRAGDNSAWPGRRTP